MNMSDAQEESVRCDWVIVQYLHELGYSEVSPVNGEWGTEHLKQNTVELVVQLQPVLSDANRGQM